MGSPFLLRHVAILLLAGANLALAGKLLASWETPAAPLWLGVSLRALTVLYAAAATVGFAVVALLFAIVELDGSSRAVWRTNAAWDDVKPGMKRLEVEQLVGPPRMVNSSIVEGTAERLAYPLHALGSLEEGQIDVKPDGTVASKHPDGALSARVRAEWIPSGYGRSVFGRAVRNVATLVALVALLALAVFAFVPFGPFTTHGSWRSWTLYAPLVALLLAAIHEACREPGGWRFDWFLLAPLHVVVVIGWLFRLIPILRA